MAQGLIAQAAQQPEQLSPLRQQGLFCGSWEELRTAGEQYGHNAKPAQQAEHSGHMVASCRNDSSAAVIATVGPLGRTLAAATGCFSSQK